MSLATSSTPPTPRPRPAPQPQTHIISLHPTTSTSPPSFHKPATNLLRRDPSPPPIATFPPPSDDERYDDLADECSVVATEDASATRRVDRILDFLKGVEEDDVESARCIRERVHAVPETESGGAGYPVGGVASGTTVFDGVKAKIMGQQMEIDDKTRTLGVLKRELKKAKDAIREQALESKKELKSKLSLQRKEYETIIKRHLAFIDKLLAEKEDLTKKCEVLTGDVKGLEKQFRDKSVILEEQHEKDLRQQRELWQAAEKIKRDKWIQEKTKAIKDQTIKGLEPEIQRMLSQHKVQIRQMEERYREELSKEKALMVEEQQRQI
ncbi:Centrosomal protein of 131 kDa, partial [Thoreauomyces humboldtii]